MPAFFKPRRRRTNSGPNKNEAKVLRRAQAEREARSAGTLKDRFPTVERLVIGLDFITPQQLFFEQETRDFGAADPFDLSVTCPGRCRGEGTFDIVDKIDSVIQARQKRVEATAVCRQPIYFGAAEVCDFKLQVKIDVTYAEA